MATLQNPTTNEKPNQTPIEILKQPRATEIPISPTNPRLQNPTAIKTAYPTLIEILKQPRATARATSPANPRLQNPTANGKPKISPIAILKQPRATAKPTAPIARSQHPNPANPIIDQMKQPDPPSKDILQNGMQERIGIHDDIGNVQIIIIE